MISIPRLQVARARDDGNLPGTGLGWWCWGTIVLLRCPFDHVCWLPHAIAADGTVSPSIVCGVKDCSFHEFGKLEGWKDGERAVQALDAAARQKAEDLGLLMHDVAEQQPPK